MVYGDGAFKDPVGQIWELADPVVSPGYTSGLEGTPNELKLKYLADNDFKDLRGDELKEAIAESDEELMEKYFDGEEFTDEEIKKGMVKGISEGISYQFAHLRSS